jgi:hypothetical protein
MAPSRAFAGPYQEICNVLYHAILTELFHLSRNSVLIQFSLPYYKNVFILNLTAWELKKHFL